MRHMRQDPKGLPSGPSALFATFRTSLPGARVTFETEDFRAMVEGDL